MEKSFEQEKPIFEVVKADDSLRTENCIVINTPEKTGADDIMRLSEENGAILEGDDKVYAIQFPDRKPELYTEDQIRALFYDIESKYEPAA